MIRRFFQSARPYLTALAILVGLGQPAWAAPGDAVCRRLSHEGAGYAVCTADLTRHEIKLFWKAPDGEPYGGFRRLVAAEDGRGLLAATNAGMYDRDLAPVGLYVENGRQLKGANTAGGEGNFHLKPNGVFYVENGRAGLLETGAYLRRRPKAEVATQSAPMLLIGGRVHPKISDEGPSRKIRNGVGVRDPQTVLFAISDEPVSFGAFARLFRDVLGCRDALFLDGSISSLYAPSLDRRDGLLPIGPIVAIAPRVESPKANGASGPR
jgi:uncharacterized protein YigE (DUF2233 family)